MRNNRHWANHVEIAFWDFVIPAMTALQRRQTTRRHSTGPRTRIVRFRPALFTSRFPKISLSKAEIKQLVLYNLYGAAGGLVLGFGITLVTILL
jgi:hypothetical protein